MCAYEAFEHTADVGLRVMAPDLSTLFAEAGQGLFSLIVDNLDTVQSSQEILIELQASDLEGLMVDWLGELLYRYETQHIVAAEFDVEVTDLRLRATIRGEPVDPDRHELHLDIKAVTYHNLRVEQAADGWQTEIILDI